MSGSNVVYVTSGQKVTDQPVGQILVSGTPENEVFDVLSGGYALTTRVYSGGMVWVQKGATLSDTHVFSGGDVEVYKGGKANASVLSGLIVNHVVTEPGYQDVYGSVTNTVVHSGGENDIFAGGAATGSRIYNGGTEYLYAGKATGAVVNSGGAQGGNGLMISTTVSAYAQQFLYSGGVSKDTLIMAQGQTQITSGGKASATMVSSGGYENVEAGGRSYGTRVFSGGNEQALSGGVSIKAVISSGGSETVFSKSTSSATTIIGGGSAYVSAGGTVKDLVISGGTAELGAGAKTAGAITFGQGPFASGGMLIIDGTKMPTAVISGFSGGEQIDLTGVKYSKKDTVSCTTSGVVTITAGTKKYQLNLAGAQPGTIPLHLYAGTTGSVLTTGLPPAAMGFLFPVATAAPVALAPPPLPLPAPPPQAAPVSASAPGTVAKDFWQGGKTELLAVISSHGGAF